MKEQSTKEIDFLKQDLNFVVENIRKQLNMVYYGNEKKLSTANLETLMKSLI